MGSGVINYYFTRRGILKLGCQYIMAISEAYIFVPGYKARRMEFPSFEPIVVNTSAEAAFEQVFRSQFRRLHGYACTILKDEDEAEEVVQNAFYKLWEQKEKMEQIQSISAYLNRMVYNDCMNYLKHQKVKATHQAFTMHHISDISDDGIEKRTLEFEHRLDTALNEMPEQCRTIFQMSRFEDMKYREIAEKMGLSVKTIENQMGKALRLMKIKLADYLPVFWVLMLNW
jgi:RNA polymerase sigma-70 factor (ECF subfamily)